MQSRRGAAHYPRSDEPMDWSRTRARPGWCRSCTSTFWRSSRPRRAACSASATTFRSPTSSPKARRSARPCASSISSTRPSIWSAAERSPTTWRSLYEYMLARLTVANAENDPAHRRRGQRAGAQDQERLGSNRDGRAMRRKDAAGPAIAAAALELSHELLQLADTGEAERLRSLDAERRRLLESVRAAARSLDEGELVLREIADLNARSLGRMEHRFRAKCRDMDMLAAGRRALRAYGHNPP